MLFKKWLVYSLLLSFFVVLTPRELWHDCGQVHEHKSFNDTHFDQKDCFACDFSLGVISHHSFHFFHFKKQYFIKFDLTLASFYFKKKFEQFSHRGPPNVSFFTV
jgi:hypothetical protein